MGKLLENFHTNIFFDLTILSNPIPVQMHLTGRLDVKKVMMLAALQKKKKIMTEQNNSEKIRTSLMRRQNVIFVAMIIVGLFLTITSQLIDKRLLSEGIAFIIVGFVGMLMSWTTMDIGASIKEAIYDVGRQNLTVLESIAKSQNEMVKSLNEMVKSLNEMVKSLNEIKEILQDK